MIGIYVTGPVALITDGTPAPTILPKGRTSGWLAAYRPGQDRGRGAVSLTNDPCLALRFPDSQAAIDFAYQVPFNRPRVAGGMPNKPLMRLGYENRDLPEGPHA